ncbi:hypothetical protein PR001_g29813 [Phytophthora rubi]|uniref:Uncharacterized protein n=1 Tax=Phytophthora rubi TaxID=129364 RepID=A0A6A3GYG0_9STRA|nr:hypothetical protein PR001_g29813 [Phytophthora rubi]
MPGGVVGKAGVVCALDVVSALAGAVNQVARQVWTSPEDAGMVSACYRRMPWTAGPIASPSRLFLAVYVRFNHSGTSLLMTA